MNLSLKQLQDLTNKLDNLDLLADEVAEINFSLIHKNVVMYKLANETQYYYFHDNEWKNMTRKQFNSLFN